MSRTRSTPNEEPQEQPDEAQEPAEEPTEEPAEETAAAEDTAAPINPLASMSADELEAELNRRSDEGPQYTREEGNALQNANAADIEAAIAVLKPADETDAEENE